MAVAGVAAAPLKPARPAVIWQAGLWAEALGMGRQTPIIASGFKALGPAPDYRFGTIRGLAHRVQILKDIA